jgi:hypothetical protein
VAESTIRKYVHERKRELGWCRRATRRGRKARSTNTRRGRS